MSTRYVYTFTDFQIFKDYAFIVMTLCRSQESARVLRQSKEARATTKLRLCSVHKCSRLVGMPAQQEVLQLYRDILKAAKRFPSIKRNQILADIKTEFHANKVSCSAAALPLCHASITLTCYMATRLLCRSCMMRHR